MPTSKYIFKALTKKDIPLLFEWTMQPHVAWWWQTASNWADFEKKYQDYIKSDHVFPFMMCENNKAFGYIQYYWIDKLDDAWVDQLFSRSAGIVGIDVFIGDQDYLAKGHGTKCMAEFIEKLWKNPEIRKIIVDPCPENMQAVGCFKKLGFKEVEQVESQHGIVAIMELNRTKKEGP
jgi:aminoglycoside 6'-N-acetyltransferase